MFSDMRCCGRLFIQSRNGYKNVMAHETPRAPLPCPEMGEIREEIDRLDREILHLLKQRLNLIEQAGVVKPRRDQVRDEARITEVLSLVKSEAKKLDYPEDMAATLWTTLVELSIDHEFMAFDGREGKGKEGG